MHDMLAPTHGGSKQNDSVRKARAWGALHARKRRRLEGSNKKSGRGTAERAQPQLPVARRSGGRQAQLPMIVVV